VAVGLGALAFALAVLLHRISEVVRGSPVESVVAGVPLRIDDPEFAGRAAAISETGLAGGHDVEVLVDRALFERMLPELEAARTSITFVTYYCEPGGLAERVVRILIARARAGVRVNFLGDDFGCGPLLSEVGDSLRAAGVALAAFRPVRWYSLHRAQHRMHARGVVIDGVVGYTGGFGIDEKWIQDSPGDPLWRDTSVRVTGPAVRQMQATFVGAWAEATGALLAGDAFFPPHQDAEGGVSAGLLYSRPGMGPTPAERYLAMTLSAAQRTLYVANSYFVPTEPLRALLADAARRGVDVRLLVPGVRIDVQSTRYAGRGFYDELLSSGVRIYEYQPAMMHAKTLVADGAWVSVGSLNLDNRSLRLNDESALLVHAAAVGAHMDSLFLADLTRAREITLDTHRARPWHQRFLELLARAAAPLL
jgi:cardiolipin synthase